MEDSSAANMEYLKLEEDIAACANKEFECSVIYLSRFDVPKHNLNNIFTYRRKVAVEYFNEKNEDSRKLLMEMFVTCNNKIKQYLYL